MYLLSSFITLNAFPMWAGLTVIVLWFFSSSPAWIEDWELSLVLWTGRKWEGGKRGSHVDKPIHPTAQMHAFAHLPGASLSACSLNHKPNRERMHWVRHFCRISQYKVHSSDGRWILSQLIPLSPFVTLWECLTSISPDGESEGKLSTIPFNS